MPTPFGTLVRKHRVAAKLSLTDVATIIGVKKVYLGEVERGERGPLSRDRWGSLLQALPTLRSEMLESAAEASRPLRIDLSRSPAEYREVGLAFARRAENQDLNPELLSKLLAMLEGRETR